MNPLDPVRGILLGLAISVVFWGLLALLAIVLL